MIRKRVISSFSTIRGIALINLGAQDTPKKKRTIFFSSHGEMGEERAPKRREKRTRKGKEILSMLL